MRDRRVVQLLLGYDFAKESDHRIKVFTTWNKDKYMRGKKGDFLACRKDDLHDVYVIERDIFYKTYENRK